MCYFSRCRFFVDFGGFCSSTNIFPAPVTSHSADTPKSLTMYVSHAGWNISLSGFFDTVMRFHRLIPCFRVNVCTPLIFFCSTTVCSAW